MKTFFQKKQSEITRNNFCGKKCYKIWLSPIIYNGADVVEWSRSLDIRLSDWCSSRGKNKNLTAQKSNSNTVWFNFQTYIYIYIKGFTSYEQYNQQ